MKTFECVEEERFPNGLSKHHSANAVGIRAKNFEDALKVWFESAEKKGFKYQGEQDSEGWRYTAPHPDLPLTVYGILRRRPMRFL